MFEYVRSQGINTISVKVAVNPTKDKEGNEKLSVSLENAKKTLKKAKKAGLKTNVTFFPPIQHNPGTQNSQMVGIN